MSRFLLRSTIVSYSWRTSGCGRTVGSAVLGSITEEECLQVRSCLCLNLLVATALSFHRDFPKIALYSVNMYIYLFMENEQTISSAKRKMTPKQTLKTFIFTFWVLILVTLKTSNGTLVYVPMEVT